MFVFRSKVPAVDRDGFFDLNTFRHALGMFLLAHIELQSQTITMSFLNPLI